jgi:hypothetical protein
MPGDEAHVERVRRAIEHLPEVIERPSHGAPTFFVRGKKSFASLWAEGHHDDDFPHLTLAAADGVQQELIAEDPDRFFRPPYVGHLGWIGLRLDQRTTDEELAELCEDAYRATAPVTLVRRLDGPRHTDSGTT